MGGGGRCVDGDAPLRRFDCPEGTWRERAQAGVDYGVAHVSHTIRHSAKPCSLPCTNRGIVTADRVELNLLKGFTGVKKFSAASHHRLIGRPFRTLLKS